MEGTRTAPTLTDLVPTETQRRRRGHRFYPPKADARRIPGLYDTEAVAPHEKMVHLHYFSGPADFYVVEVDPADGRAFGFVVYAGQAGEWGYFSLPELEALAPRAAVAGGALHLSWVIERDKWWTPVPFAEAVR